MNQRLATYCASCHLDLAATLAWLRRSFRAGDREAAGRALASFAGWMEGHLKGFSPEYGDLDGWKQSMLAEGLPVDEVERNLGVARLWIDWLMDSEGAEKAQAPASADALAPAGGGGAADGTVATSPDEALDFLCSGEPEVDGVVMDWLDSADLPDPMGVLASLSAFVEWRTRRGGAPVTDADVDAWVYDLEESIVPAAARAHGANVRAFAAWYAGVSGSGVPAAGDARTRRPCLRVSPSVTRYFGVDDSRLAAWQQRSAASDLSMAELVSALEDIARWASSHQIEGRLLTLRDVDAWHLSLSGRGPAAASEYISRRVREFFAFACAGDGTGTGTGHGSAAGDGCGDADLSPVCALFGVSRSCIGQWLREQNVAGGLVHDVKPLVDFSRWCADHRCKAGTGHMGLRAPLDRDVESWVDSLGQGDTAAGQASVRSFLSWVRARGFLLFEPDCTPEEGAGREAADAAADASLAQGAERLGKKVRRDEFICRVFDLSAEALELWKADTLNSSAAVRHVAAFAAWLVVFFPGCEPLPEHIRRWQELLLTRMSSSSAKNNRSSVRQFMRWLHARGLYGHAVPEDDEDRARAGSGSSALLLEVFGLTDGDVDEWRRDRARHGAHVPGMTAINSFALWLKEQEPRRSPRELPGDDEVRAWSDYLRGDVPGAPQAAGNGEGELPGPDGRKRIADSTANTYRHVVRSFLRWFEKKGLLVRAQEVDEDGADGGRAQPASASGRYDSRPGPSPETVAAIFRITAGDLAEWQVARAGTARRKISLSPVNKFAQWWCSTVRDRSRVPTLADVGRWGRVMQSGPFSQKTVSVYLSQVRGFLRWASARSAVEARPARAGGDGEEPPQPGRDSPAAAGPSAAAIPPAPSVPQPPRLLRAAPGTAGAGREGADAAARMAPPVAAKTWRIARGFGLSQAIVERWVEEVPRNARECADALAVIAAMLDWMDTHASGRPPVPRDVERWHAQLSRNVARGRSNFAGDTVRGFLGWLSRQPDAALPMERARMTAASHAASRVFGIDCPDLLLRWRNVQKDSDEALAAGRAVEDFIEWLDAGRNGGSFFPGALDLWAGRLATRFPGDAAAARRASVESFVAWVESGAFRGVDPAHPLWQHDAGPARDEGPAAVPASSFRDLGRLRSLVVAPSAGSPCNGGEDEGPQHDSAPETAGGSGLAGSSGRRE